LGVYRALLSVYRALLSVYRALLSVYRALLSVHRSHSEREVVLGTAEVTIRVAMKNRRDT